MSAPSSAFDEARVRVASFPAPSYEPLPVNPELIEEVRIGINLLPWLT